MTETGNWRARVTERMSRCDTYRELLERWMGWFAGPGLEYGLHELPILPPVSDTAEALKCSVCQGITESGTCVACGRTR